MYENHGAAAEGEQGLPDDLAVAIYEHMVTAREVDRRVITLQREGRIGAHASAIGEEAAVLGAVAAMHDDDWVFLGSREFAAALWRGMPLAYYASHLFGTRHDAGKGRNAPGLPFHRPANVPSVSPLVGTHIPHAVGVAWAARMRKQDIVALVFLGEGATSTGDFHVGLNFAGVTRAPVVAVCRNNGWATSTPASRQTASDGFAIKAIAYGLRGETVDGGDVGAVFDAVSRARARAASGEGGTLIEAVTTPPGESEPPEAWAQRDPVGRMRRQLEARSLWSASREAQLRTDLRADIERALEERAGDPAPDFDTMFDDVYAQRPWHLRAQAAGART